MDKKRLVKLILIGLGGASLIGVIVVTSVIAYFSFGLPKISSLADYNPPVSSQILSKDGTVLADIGKEKREIATMEEIPAKVVDAFLSAEDDKFYEHKGVDYMGVLRALVVNIRAGRVVQGGSTITQQVAKSLLLSRERSIARKIKDFLLAQRIEEKFSKEEILFLYLNQVYLGGGYYGVKSAFHGYFDKELSESTIAEAAMIAGLLVAPGKYSPYINPAYAKRRQGYVLKRLYATKKITREEYEAALLEKTKFRIRKPGKFKAGYFTDWVRQRVISLVGEENFLVNGYKVETTLDWKLQQVAEKAVKDGVKGIDKRQGFSGPIGRIESEDDLTAHEIEFRKNIYSGTSTYFTINENNIKEYEISFSRDEFDKIKLKESEIREEMKSKNFRAGLNSNDPLYPFIKKDEMYKAVVLDTNRKGRIIYVSIGGVIGIIPYSGFRWAHERSITGERQFYPYIKDPNQVVKKGDVVWVTVEKRSANYKMLADKSLIERLNKIKNKKLKALIKKQKFIHCKLDQDPIAQGALVSIDPFTGDVHAFVGGADFAKSQFNRAIQSKRQPGSSFKPILFAAGLEKSFTPASVIIDSPEALGGVDSSLNWKPRNYDGKFKGPITFRNSLEQSRNVPTIKIADRITVPGIFEFSKRIGFNAELDPDLSVSLGSFGVTLMDIVATYSIFPNGGKRVYPKTITKITDRNGKQYFIEEIPTQKEEGEEIVEGQADVTPSPTPEETQKVEEGSEIVAQEEVKEENPFTKDLTGDQVYDERLAYIMTNLLRGVVLHGTGRGARSVSTFLGGKTGTTNSYVDAWFLGFSSNLVTGVWTGFDDNKTLGWGETGAKSALPIWKDFMSAGLKKFGEYDFKIPRGIINVLIDKETGDLARSSQKNAFMEAFVEGTEPGLEKNTNILPNQSDSNDTSTQIFEEDDYFNNQ
ncbi:MAG: PBP1A family penicillin-binding protein [Bacteriovoracaceae bacterium]|nr:PBP1A family penicillin-binding protein [Bacteriovoracaceae bacterium]